MYISNKTKITIKYIFKNLQKKRLIKFYQLKFINELFVLFDHLNWTEVYTTLLLWLCALIVAHQVLIRKTNLSNYIVKVQNFFYGIVIIL